MAIYVTGDIHGNPFARLSTDSFFEQKELTGDQNENVVIILGDFGIVWNKDGETAEEKWKLDWLEKKHFTTVFVDGNHENHPRLATYTIKEWNCGKVHEIRPHVLHLMRGEVFEIQGKKFFAFGGASSHDISDGILDGNDKNWKKQAKQLDAQGKWKFRVRGISWWEEELPSEEEMENGRRNLEKHNWKVDFVLTHSPSASVVALLGSGMYDQDILTKYLEELRMNLDYKKWFAGHFHMNRAINDKDLILYEQIVQIA